MKRLDELGLRVAVRQLGTRDPDLQAVLDAHGPPPLWAREPGFATLVHIILEQQVSLASARAAFDNLVRAIGAPEPSAFLALDGASLKRIGFSRQKTRYCRRLAEAVRDGELDLDDVAALGDAEARTALTALPGIGPWTADIYLLMALGRPDIWPLGDLALVRSAQSVKRLPAPPQAAELERIAEAWKPWRSAAARLLWHAYLCARRARPAG